MTSLPSRATSASAGIALTAAAALALATLVFVLRPLSLNVPAAGLDASWTAVLAEAAARHARWGVDLAFTYGPASALVTRFYTDGYLPADLPILCAVGLVNGAAMAWLARDAAAARASGTRGFAVAVAVMASGLAAGLLLDQDGFYFTFCLTLVFVDLLRPSGDKASLAAVAAGAFLMGVVALSKTSFGVVALLLFTIADLRILSERFPVLQGRSRTEKTAPPRPPLLVPLFGLAFLATFLAYGQRIGDLPSYLTLQGQVAAGYGEAMYILPARGELLGFLFGAAGVTMLAAVLAPARLGPHRGAVAAVSTALVLLMACKAGFIRADTHPQIAWTVLGVAAILVAIVLALPRSVIVATALGASGLVVLWVVAPLFLLAATDRSPALSRLPAEIYRPMIGALNREVSAWVLFLRSPEAFAAAARDATAANWAAIRALHPLPVLEGGVDMIPSEQSTVLASGLDYRPRPSFQDYSTYSAGLIAANAAFYAGPKAPAWVLFDGSVLDDRYPTTGEGALWPALLRDYEPVRRIGDWLALHRRTAPLPEVLGPPVRVVAPLGSPVAVPMDGPVFVRIGVAKTLLGRLAGALFRPPGLRIGVTLTTGREQTYRFIPALGAGGFLLSPIVADPDAFAVLATAAGEPPGADRVRSFVVGGSSWTKLFYDAAMTVEFQPVTITPVPPSPEARALSADLAAHMPWRRLIHALGRDSDLYGVNLTAQPPNTLSVPLAGERRLRVEFGLEDGVWNDHKTQGVCFSVKTSPDALEPLWQRCLDPVAAPADRGRQWADLDLPAGLSAVTAQTACFKGCEWTWSYWSMIQPRD